MTITIPWFYPQVGEREQERVAAVVASNYINDGGVAREFEARIAELVGLLKAGRKTRPKPGLD